MQYTLKQIADITEGTIYGNPEALINSVAYDTRLQFDANQSLFVALVSINNNGHKFLSKAIAKGCTCVLVSENIDLPKNVSKILVKDTLAALQKWAACHREKFTFPIVAITGSMGKTTTKEWFYQAVGNSKMVYKSPKSFNSQLGVALSVLRCDTYADLAIFEAGISHEGEMLNLQKMLKPQIGFITNIGEAHQANFTTINAKLKEKLLLFKDAETILYCSNQKVVEKAIVETYPHKKKYSWGSKETDALRVNHFSANSVSCSYKEKRFEINVKGNNSYHFENVMNCLLLGLVLELEPAILARNIGDLKPLPMRLEMKQGKHGTILVNDSYSADFQSLEVALDYLFKVGGNQNKTLVLSQFDDQKVSAKAYEDKLNDYVKRYELKKVVLVGSQLLHLKIKASKLFAFANTQELLQKTDVKSFEGEAVLVKGARRYQLEKLIYLFQAKSHKTRLEINLSALRNNYGFIKNQTKGKIMVMLKALGYGAGTFELARLLESLQANYIAVAYIDEGVSLRQKGINLPIMVLSPEQEGFVNIIKYGLEPEIYSKNLLNDLLQFLKNETPKEPILLHINIDTGMKRLGFDKQDIAALIATIKENESYVKVASVFTHLVASDNADFDTFTQSQVNSFESVLNQFREAFSYPILAHCANTGAAIRHPNAYFDMVRLGIGFYGINPSGKSITNLDLAFRWLTQVSQIHTVEIGESVGYSRAWLAKRRSKVATLPVGYADGLNRSLGNGVGSVYIKGLKAKIIGSVCMDMCMIDITDLAVEEGDEVVIFENQEELLDLCSDLDTIPYELLATISERVKRVYMEE